MDKYIKNMMYLLYIIKNIIIKKYNNKTYNNKNI